MCMYICIVKAGVGRLGEAVTARDKPKKAGFSSGFLLCVVYWRLRR